MMNLVQEDLEKRPVALIVSSFLEVGENAVVDLGVPVVEAVLDGVGLVPDNVADGSSQDGAAHGPADVLQGVPQLRYCYQPGSSNCSYKFLKHRSYFM